MSDCKERIYKLEGTERFGMNSLLLIIRNFELSSKPHMCEQSSHIRLKVSKIMETFLPTFIKEVI